MFLLTLILVLIVLSVFVGAYINMLYNYRRKVRVFESIDAKDKKTIKEYKQAPGPIPWPIIGNLFLLAKYRVPFQAFTELSKELGDIYTLTLGSTRCLVINNLELIREVLNKNGKSFGGRPDFARYHKLFGGDRNNSLALCDWSSLQQKRRSLARRHCSPRSSSSYFSKMSDVGVFEVSKLMEQMKDMVRPGDKVDIKSLIQQTCANMFMHYMCSKRFEYNDAEFQMIVKYFDEIFWEINQGYALDFLPFLSLFYQKHTNSLLSWSSNIRKFILERIVNEREKNVDLSEPEVDFTDALLKNLIENKHVSRDTIIYMLEDFIGGHSAVGNLVMLTLGYIVKNPEVGKRIQLEIDAISKECQRKINLYDMEQMPYTMATIFEVLRYSSSPIVPHVATEETVVAGYGVTKGTVVFINNYKLNISSEYWKDPNLFNPQRFLQTLEESEFSKDITSRVLVENPADIILGSKRRSSEGSDSGIEYDKDLMDRSSSMSENSVLSPLSKSKNSANVENWQREKIKLKSNIPHFLPFSIGKRTCIGQNLLRGFSFILLTNILQYYNISCKHSESIKIVPACIALPTTTFPLEFIPRNSKFNNNDQN